MLNNKLNALVQHRAALSSRKQLLAMMITTVDKTIAKIKGEIMLSDNELYDSFPADAKKYRKEALEKYGEKTVRRSEDTLRKLSKEMQDLIARHYELIRIFWGTSGNEDSQTSAYAGLRQLYVDDKGFMSKDDKPRPHVAVILRDAMKPFSENPR